jgi:hypothetical protein
VGQLDGGHIIFSLFPGKFNLLARLFFFLLLPLGYFWQGWWFWALMIALIGGLKPAPVVDSSLDLAPRQRALGYISVVIFILTFIPVPFSVLGQ